jgi:hypothetical protein
MKKLAFILLITVTSTIAFAQEKAKDTTATRTLSADGTHYKASNGTVYNKGGTIQIGSAVGGNRTFMHIHAMIGNLVLPDGVISTRYAGTEFPIDSFGQEKNGMKRVYTISKLGTRGKLAVFIEAGLAAGEVK